VGRAVRIGVIGCGAIARQYLDTARWLDAIEIVAAADGVHVATTESWFRRAEEDE
jgi:predicted homoserine dehydrogenase-like protein